jgi:hypothetical protein
VKHRAEGDFRETELADLRPEVARDLPMHATSPAHPHHCLCGMWDGSGSYEQHVVEWVLGHLWETAR